MLLKKLEALLSNYFDVRNLNVVCNGQAALQLAIKALDLKGEIITTPYSYVATTNAILWEGCTPIFVDIELDSFCIDVNKIEQSITSKTVAILATHVYGNPCNTDVISNLAKKYNLKVIYDAAHAFGVSVSGKSILNNGDISILSFHSTKIFHTVEGGAVICKSKRIHNKVSLMKAFGHCGDKYKYT